MLGRLPPHRRVTGPGVSTAHGPVEVRPVQVGFPAELLGPFDVTTGYPWKMLAPSPVAAAAADPELPVVGVNAISVYGDTSLAAGARGWLERDPSDSTRYWFAHPPRPTEAASCGGCGWVAGLDPACCLVLSVAGAAGRCGATDPAQRLLLAYDAGSGKWVSAAAFDCGAAAAAGCVDPAANVLRLKVAWEGGACAPLVTGEGCGGLYDLHWNSASLVRCTVTGAPVSGQYLTTLLMGRSGAAPSGGVISANFQGMQNFTGSLYPWNLVCTAHLTGGATYRLFFYFNSPWCVAAGVGVLPTLVSMSAARPFAAVYTVPAWALGGNGGVPGGSGVVTIAFDEVV